MSSNQLNDERSKWIIRLRENVLQAEEERINGAKAYTPDEVEKMLFGETED